MTIGPFEISLFLDRVYTKSATNMRADRPLRLILLHHRFLLPQFLLLVGIGIVIGFILSTSEQQILPGEHFVLQHQTLKPASKSLQIAWLSSFPNSGTSYTLRLVQGLSQTLTANNYGIETPKVQAVTPQLNRTGPYWGHQLIENIPYSKPTNYVLTKTHCGGRCVNCYPKFYLQSFQSFRDACYSTSRPTPKPTPQRPFELNNYRHQPVQKVVHLIRDPVDNIVSRYHNWRFNTNQPGDGTRKDFRDWCEGLHTKTVKEEVKFDIWGPETWEIWKDVPCRTDFFRYAQWHNYAFALAHDEEMDALIVHYEDYAKPETQKNLINFLELPSVGKAPTFQVRPSYKSHFTTKELRQIRIGLERFSTQSTWQRLQRYFPHD